MLMNKQQTCGFLGWTSGEFDRNVSRGFPAKKLNRSRGTDWQVDSREAVDWVVEQEAPKFRPRTAKPYRSDPPPGWEAFKAAEAVDDPLAAAAMVNLLWLLYCLPRLTANVVAGFGVGIEDTWRISVTLLMVACEQCRRELEYWPKDDPDTLPLLHEAFE